MAEIGKSLVFYLKYFPEMQRLYEEEEGSFPEIDQRPDQELILKMIDDVGQAAGVDARHLLEECVAEMRTRLEDANAVKLNPPMNKAVERNWGLGFDVRPLEMKQSFKKIMIGIDLDRDGLTPWVWSRGGIAKEAEIRSCFAQGVESFGSKKKGWQGGSVLLSTINIKYDQSTDDFTLDAEVVIARTRKACEAFTPEFLKRVIALP